MTTTLPTTPRVTLNEWLKQADDLQMVVVAGITKDGQMIWASSSATPIERLAVLEQTKLSVGLGIAGVLP